MRRRRRNPEPLTLLLLGGAALVAAVAGISLFGKAKKPQTILRSTTGTAFGSQPEFVGLPNAEGFLKDDCIVAVQGAAGFSMPGDVPAGENTILKIVSSGGASATSVQAVSTDPRVTTRDVVTVPMAAVSGGGDCSIV